MLFHNASSTRSLTDGAIRQNSYRTLRYGKGLRDRIAAQLSARFDLNGIPGFFYAQSAWRMCAYSGLLVPVRAADGRIQGIQIRRDNADRMKYAWMSSAGKPYGTGARSWIHVAGDRNKKQAIITEGAIKGDVSSTLTERSLFICLPGVNAVSFLNDTLRELRVTQAWEAFDMDKRCNPQVRAAVIRLRQEMKKAGIPCRMMAWDPAYKGIDDFLVRKRSTEYGEQPGQFHGSAEQHRQKPAAGRMPLLFTGGCAGEKGELRTHLQCAELPYMRDGVSRRWTRSGTRPAK